MHRVALGSSLLALLACGGLLPATGGDGAAPPPASAPPFPARMLTERGGRWVVYWPCDGDAPGLRQEGADFYVTAAQDVENYGPVATSAATPDGWRVTFVSRYDGQPATVDARWGDATHTWFTWREARWAPDAAVPTTFAAEHQPASACGG